MEKVNHHDNDPEKMQGIIGTYFKKSVFHQTGKPKRNG